VSYYLAANPATPLLDAGDHAASDLARITCSSTLSDRRFGFTRDLLMGERQRAVEASGSRLALRKFAVLLRAAMIASMARDLLRAFTREDRAP
jgi:hypothetical protein